VQSGTVQGVPGRSALEASSVRGASERKGAYADRDSRMAHDRERNSKGNSSRNSNSKGHKDSDIDSDSDSNSDSVGDSESGLGTSEDLGASGSGPEQSLEDRCAVEGMERRQKMRRDRDTRVAE